MGSSVSKTKTMSMITTGKLKTGFPSSTTSSSERTLVEESAESKTKKKKPSILPNGSFFNIARAPRTKESKHIYKKPVQNYHHTSIKKTTVSRKKPKSKKKNISKSIIGKPTNFKHLNSSTSSNGHVMNANSNEEDAVFASQMIELANLIKPLPSSMSEVPIIPPRKSSYGNEAYLKSYSISSTPLHAPSKPRKSRRSPATPSSSIKKSKKNSQVKYVSIGKSSLTRKRVYHNKMPRELGII